jgi:hypothetical protein
MRYPGFAWKHLPPWDRPRWKYGGGWCWRYYTWGSVPFPAYEARDEADLLEQEAKYLEERLAEVRKRLEGLRK